MSTFNFGKYQHFITHILYLRGVHMLYVSLYWFYSASEFDCISNLPSNFLGAPRPAHAFSIHNPHRPTHQFLDDAIDCSPHFCSTGNATAHNIKSNSFRSLLTLDYVAKSDQSIYCMWDCGPTVVNNL